MNTARFLPLNMERRVFFCGVSRVLAQQKRAYAVLRINPCIFWWAIGDSNTEPID